MAKPRKKYSYKKRSAWQWIIFYALIGFVILALIYYSGILGFGEYNNPGNQAVQEIQYFE